MIVCIGGGNSVCEITDLVIVNHIVLVSSDIFPD